MSSQFLDSGLEELAADALLVLAEGSRDPDLAPFVGSAHLGQAFVLWPRGQRPRLGYLVDMERDEAARAARDSEWSLEVLEPDARELARMRGKGASTARTWTCTLDNLFEAAGLDAAAVALAGHPSAGLLTEVADHFEQRGFKFLDGRDLSKRLRKKKGPADLEAVRAAAVGTAAAFRRVASVLASCVPSKGELSRQEKPLTVGELRREIAIVLAEHGLEQPEGNIVAPGADGGVPHSRGDDDSILLESEGIVVDLYPRGRLFADCTRTFCVGEPSEALSTAHRACLDALELAKGLATPGAVGADLQSAVCDLLEGRGFATPRSSSGTQVGYVHGLGHGVGYELHELPSFRPGAGRDGELDVDDVFTLEPGLYDPGQGYGVRLEDLLIMGEDGVEVLTQLPYDLDPRAWGEGAW